MIVAGLNSLLIVGGRRAGMTGGNRLHTETVFPSSVTAPLSAISLPLAVAPVVAVTLAFAITLPTNVEVVPSVAELPTCQNTLHAGPRWSRAPASAAAVVSVLPILKMKTALGLPWALSVSVPVSCADVEKQ